MTPQLFAAAIGVVESHGNPNAPLGDAGRAFGRFQCHPDWVWTWAHKLVIAPQLGELWDSFIERLVCGYYTFHSTSLEPVEIAMSYHLGHICHEGDADWDGEYATKFVSAVS